MSTCLPPTATANAARSATSVLPNPTSPAVHRPRRLQVLLHRLDRSPLVRRLLVRELGLEALDPLVVDLVRHSGARLPLRVELDQVAGHLPQVLARAGLEVVPGLPAELRERRCLRVGADVAADLADLLVRDEDAVLAAEAEQQVVARDARDLLRLEPEQLRDAVVLVDDVVAGAEVGEGLQRAPGRGGRARRALPEDLRVGEQGQAELAPDEAASRGGDREGQALGLGAVFEDARLDAAEHLLLPQRLAAVRERDDDVELLPEEPVQLVLRLRQATRGKRRALRVERERLSLR
jgi:hypothetical protein